MGQTFWLGLRGDGDTMHKGTTMNDFLSLFADSTKVTATVSYKLPDGTRATAKLAQGPADLTDESFGQAAMAGTSFSYKGTSDDKARTRAINRKSVHGAAARSAVLNLLGATDAVPPKVRQRGRNATPSENGTHTDATS